jgi:hypothetical protein
MNPPPTERILGPSKTLSGGSAPGNQELERTILERNRRQEAPESMLNLHGVDCAQA